MKIGFITGGFEYGGAQRVLCNLANCFVKDGHSVVVITFAHNESSVYPLDKNIKWINGIGWNNYFDGIYKLHNILKKEKLDIAISFVVQYNIASIIASAGLKCPLIISERNDPKNVPQETYKRLLRKLTYRYADGYVFQTKEAQQFFSKSIQKQSAIIPNPLFLSGSFNNDHQRAKTIMAAARLLPQKNHLMLIRAFAQIASDFPEWNVVIYGDGDIDYIKQINHCIQNNHLGERVTLHDAIDNIHEAMAENSIFVLTSNYEGMPNSLMEAMGMGMACISTACPCGGPEFLIENGRNGFLVPVNDSISLSKALCELMTNDELRRNLSMNALEIRKTLDIKNIYAQWNEYIMSII